MKNHSIIKLGGFILIAAFFLFTCTNNNISNSASKEKSNNKSKGLSIYTTSVDINSNLTYQDFNLEDAELIGEPIISYDQIISYDTTHHVITLSFSRGSLKNKIGQIGVYGKPFIVTLDSQKIYGGWFWLPISSVPCHSVVIELESISDTLAANEIRIKLGYPNKDHFKGIDPRNNRKIIDRLIKDKKLK